jgi:transcriptional regulator with XRE-family HTH domain
MEESFGGRLRSLRQSQGKTQREMAQLIGQSQGGYSRLEARPTPPRNYVQLARKLAETLDEPTESILEQLVPQVEEEQQAASDKSTNYAAFAEYPWLAHVLGAGWQYLDANQKLLVANTAYHVYQITVQLQGAPMLPVSYQYTEAHKDMHSQDMSQASIRQAAS